eukprot:TRINITY_DN4565_c0_g2_i1.p1 TRINITY_DN4565_c0_g2~~TRINITY_DN4565_c0_g2_i1.p1  ORF type:complete len:287 (+),score=65.76 TRINITY_DN4565_c0_g2_i1:131-862(+)
MAELPLEPMYAKAIIMSKEMDCISEILTIISMLSVENIFIFPQNKQAESKIAKERFSSVEGDHITLLNVYNTFMSIDSQMSKKDWCYSNFLNYRSLIKVKNIRDQLIDYCFDMKLISKSDIVVINNIELSQSDVINDSSIAEKVNHCLTLSFFMHSAIRHPSGYYVVKMANDQSQQAYIHPSSVLFGKKPSCIIFTEIVHTTRVYLRDVSVINIDWLIESSKHYFQVNVKSKASNNYNNNNNN